MLTVRNYLNKNKEMLSRLHTHTHARARNNTDENAPNEGAVRPLAVEFRSFSPSPYRKNNPFWKQNQSTIERGFHA